MSWHCYHTAVGSDISHRSSGPRLPICTVRGGSDDPDIPSQLPACTQNCRNVWIPNWFREEGTKEGTVSECAPCKDVKFKNWGATIQPPIWPCIHFSVHSSSRYHYNSDRESNTTDDSHCVQKESPWMEKALWKTERRKHFSQDLGVVITLLHPWNQAKIISNLVSALNIWVTSGSLFNFSKPPSLSVKTRVSGYQQCHHHWRAVIL